MENIKPLADQLIDVIGDKTATFELQLNQVPFLMMCMMSFMYDEVLTPDQRQVASTHYADFRWILIDSIPETLPIIKEIEANFGMTIIEVLKNYPTEEN